MRNVTGLCYTKSSREFIHFLIRIMLIKFLFIRLCILNFDYYRSLVKCDLNGINLFKFHPFQEYK